MPSIEDWINSPLGIIQTLFEKQGNFESAAVRDYFGEKVKTKNALSWIPSLNDIPLHELRANCLVRYRCMIQDMFDPEFYLGAYQVKDSKTGQTQMRSGKYKDVAECGVNQSIDVECGDNITMDRMTLYCVPVPGEAEWVKKAHGDISKSKNRCYASTSKMPNRCKRGLDEETSDSTNNAAVNGNGMVTNGNSNGNMDTMDTDSSDTTKRQQTEKQPESSGTKTSKTPDLNFPLPGEVGPACIVKVYDNINSFKVNDIVEFFGVLSVDPSLAQFTSDGSTDSGDTVMGGVEENEEELSAHSPPPSLVPRLHAVIANHMSHVNPLVPQPNTDDYKTVLCNLQVEIDSLRTEILSVLQHAMLGDSLAAEYCLCHLISTVYGRADVIPLGKYCINISNSPHTATYGDLLHHLISNLVTQSHILHMSLENMNSLAFSPQKDYNANRLKSGILQLAPQTNLVIDETALQSGQLDVNGVKNIQALGNLISWQKVEYDFNFHKQDFPSNVAALILSEGKSLLPSDCQLPLKPEVVVDQIRDYFTLLDPRLTDNLLTTCRTYIGVARNMDYTLQEDVQKVIQDDFVTMRKEDQKNMSVDDFHALLCLTRLLSLSQLRSSPTLEIWNKAKTMEQERKCRITPGTSRTTPSS